MVLQIVKPIGILFTAKALFGWIKLTDGRFIKVIRTPLSSGGWVALHDDITEKRQREARIIELAHRDDLTGLANRKLFKQTLNEKCEKELNTGFSLLLLDLDHFKMINDTLGHPVGDKLLTAVGLVLQQVVRKMDLVARLGGDEFAIIVGDIDAQQEAMAVADRIARKLHNPIMIERACDSSKNQHRTCDCAFTWRRTGTASPGSGHRALPCQTRGSRHYNVL